MDKTQVLNSLKKTIAFGSLIDVGLILILVGTFIPKWGTGSNNGVTTSIGIWKNCFSKTNNGVTSSTCADVGKLNGLNVSTSDMNIVRGLFLSGLALTLLCFMFAITKSFYGKHRKIASFLLYCATLLMLASCIVFYVRICNIHASANHDKISAIGINPGASFYLVVVGSIFILLSGVTNQFYMNKNTLFNFGR
jgi:hypothetical protein